MSTKIRQLDSMSSLRANTSARDTNPSNLPPLCQLYDIDSIRVGYDGTQDPEWLVDMANELMRLFAQMFTTDQDITTYQESEQIFYEDSVVHNLAADMYKDCKEAEEIVIRMNAIYDRMKQKLEDFEVKAELLRAEESFSDE